MGVCYTPLVMIDNWCTNLNEEDQNYTSEITTTNVSKLNLIA